MILTERVRRTIEDLRNIKESAFEIQAASDTRLARRANKNKTQDNILSL